MQTIEHSADTGWAVRQNGTILLRTASDSDWQAMGNALCLVFGAPPAQVDWSHPDQIRGAFEACCEMSDNRFEVIRICGVAMVGEG